jgi:chromosome segregation ATPase
MSTPVVPKITATRMIPEQALTDTAPTAPPEEADLTAAVARLVSELADERRRRAVADEARRDIEQQLQSARLEAARTGAELTAAQARIGELERDRDQVIRRAEQLLTGVRERADLMAQRVQDAWLATAVLRRARPLRLPTVQPETAAEAEEEVLEALDQYEIDPGFAEQSPELADEIDDLRQRLRNRVHHPLDIDAVEDGVDQLREARLARQGERKGRRRK